MDTKQRYFIYAYHLPWAIELLPAMFDAILSFRISRERVCKRERIRRILESQQLMDRWAVCAMLTTPIEWLRGTDSRDEAIRIASIEEQEREFHEFVREHIICLLFFICLYLFSYWLISRYKERTDSDYLYAGEEDYIVYRISVWMCTTSLAGSIGSIALLPFSILGAELLQRYPDSYWLKWLSSSLLHSMWNYVFFLSNLSFFLLLPFAYFFIESQGFNKKKSGLRQRTFETSLVCLLVVVVLLCLSDLTFNLLFAPSPNSTLPSPSLLFSFGLSMVNIPLLYSFVSLLGVVLLLVSTPLGFSKMFSIITDLSQIRPPPIDDVTIDRLQLSCKQRMDKGSPTSDYESERSNGRRGLSNGYSRLRRGKESKGTGVRSSDTSALSDSETTTAPHSSFGAASGDWLTSYVSLPPSSPSSPSSRSPHSSPPSSPSSSSLSISRSFHPLRQKSLRWYEHLLRTIKYTIAILAMTGLTGMAVLLVSINTLKLLLGYRALPMYAQYIEVNSRHAFGMVGVTVEMVIIVYVMATSIVGAYSLPLVRNIKPIRGRTSMTAVIINCSLVVLLSSALPVLASTLGLTTFDLVGLYTSVRWLSNFKLVVTYNVVFVVVTTAVVVSRVTSPVRNQLLKSLGEVGLWKNGPPIVEEHEKTL